MLYGRFQRPMRVAASAGMLIMALAPPAVHHSHTEGERQHKHSPKTIVAAPHIPHSHPHSRPHAHHHAAARDEQQYSRGAVGHCHMAWLSFEFVLLTPASPASSQGEDGQMAQELVPLFAANEFADGPRQPSAIAAAPLCMPALPGIDGLLAEAPPQIVAAGAISNHLCDTARHARSGVQLI